MKPPAFPVTNRSSVKRSGSGSTLGGASFHTATETALRDDAYAEDLDGEPAMEKKSVRVSMFVCCASKPKVVGDGLLVRNVSAFT